MRGTEIYGEGVGIKGEIQVSRTRSSEMTSPSIACTESNATNLRSEGLTDMKEVIGWNKLQNVNVQTTKM